MIVPAFDSHSSNQNLSPRRSPSPPIVLSDEEAEELVEVGEVEEKGHEEDDEEDGWGNLDLNQLPP